MRENELKEKEREEDKECKVLCSNPLFIGNNSLLKGLEEVLLKKKCKASNENVFEFLKMQISKRVKGTYYGFNSSFQLNLINSFALMPKRRIALKDFMGKPIP